MTRRPHVLFLNAQDDLGADVAVHLMIARSLDRRQVRVSFATSVLEVEGASVRKELESIDDLEVLPLLLGRPIGKYGGVGRLISIMHNVRGVTSLLSLARWCRANQVDLIHVTERPRQALFGLVTARLAGSACLIQAHTGYGSANPSRFFNWRLHQASAVVGISDYVASSFQQGANLPPEHVFTVHNAVDSEMFAPRPSDADQRVFTRRRLGIPRDALVIGCIARLMAWKGQQVLLEAFAAIREQVPRAHLVLAGKAQQAAPDGPGDYRDYLLRRISALGLDEAVTMVGFLPQADMPEFYQSLDVVAHPAIYEPFGLAVVEAMASTRPVVAVARGGIPEIIRDGRDGLLIRDQDAEALTEALMRILKDPALAQSLGQAGRARVVEQFTPARQAARMAEVYRAVLGQPSPGEDRVNQMSTTEKRADAPLVETLARDVSSGTLSRV
jgi:glycosyltransferase involved in cell wall biosynthesis